MESHKAGIAELAERRVARVRSPCVRNCCLDQEDVCVGCYRSLQEILRWSEASDDERKEILAHCQDRRQLQREKADGI